MEKAFFEKTASQIWKSFWNIKDKIANCCPITDSRLWFENEVCYRCAIIWEVPQKLCVAQPFLACGNTVAPKLRTHVNEGIPSA